MAANTKEKTALLRGVIAGRVVTCDQMMAAFQAGFGPSPIPALPMVVRGKRDDREWEFRLGLEVTQLTRRTCGSVVLCDFMGKVVYVSGIGGERLQGALVQGTIDLSCSQAVTNCQGRLECLRPLLAEAA